MNLNTIKLFRYSLPFKSPVKLGRELYSKREGILIELIAESGQSSWGECAPLPFFSYETIDACLTQLKTTRAQITNGLTDPTRLLDQADKLFPSVAFGIETALSIFSEIEDTSQTEKFVKLNGLITPNDANPIAAAEKLVKRGYRSIKIKVGRRDLNEEIEMLRSIAAVLPDGVTLRLDANQAWTLDQAIEFCRAVESFPIDYFEEPLADSDKLLRLTEQTPLRLALDESFRTPNGMHLLKSGRFKALVLKPTLTGRHTLIKQISEHAAQLGVTVVISSAYESGVGLNSLARLAGELAPDTPHGLDTLSAFETDLLDINLFSSPAQIRTIPAGEFKLNRSYLAEVTDD